MAARPSIASSRSSSAGGAGVVGLAGHVDPPPAVRPDVAADPHGVAEVDQGRGPARRAARRRCRPAPGSRRRGRGSRGRGRRAASPRPWSCRRGSVSPRARSAPSAPVMTREPAQAMPKRAPSSSAKLTTPTGRAGAKPSCRSSSTAASAATTPSGPSKAPPSGTESRCEPMTTPGSPAATAASGSPHQAHWLPIRSVVRSSPRSAHSPGEPLPQVVVLAGQGETVVAAAVAVEPEALEVVPHPPEP